MSSAPPLEVKLPRARGDGHSPSWQAGLVDAILYAHTVFCIVNAPHFREVLLQDEPTPQLPLELQMEGVLRYVWSGRFGQMLIEVRDGVPYVNGEPVALSDAIKHRGNKSSTQGEST
jgi:hypothetical protein